MALAAKHPTDSRWQRDLSVAHNKIGDLLRQNGKPTDALGNYKEAFSVRAKLAQADPENVQAQVDVAMAHYRLGQIHSSLGDKLEALNSFRSGKTLLEPIVRQTQNSIWRTSLEYFDAEIVTLSR